MAAMTWTAKATVQKMGNQPRTGMRARAVIIWEVLLFVGIVVADSYGLVPLTQTVALLPMSLLAMWLQRQKLSTIGFSWPSNARRAVLAGIAAGIAMELLALWITTPLISHLTGVQVDNRGLSPIRGNLPMLLLFLGLSWTFAAFGEELCFRGFLMERLARFLGGGRWAWWASLVLSSVLFGWGHTEQGITGWMQEGLSGFLLGLLFLATGRNLTAAITAHGVSNTLAFVLIFLGHYPGLK